MFKNRTFIIVLCVILCALLGVLIVFERKDPELGSELMRRLLRCGA